VLLPAPSRPARTRTARELRREADVAHRAARRRG
jgi:hypothetical protein